MKKLITIAAALAVVLMVSGAMAAGTIFYRIGVAVDPGGFAYTYSCTNDSCGTNCIRYSTQELPYIFDDVMGTVHMTDANDHYEDHDWWAMAAETGVHYEPDSVQSYFTYPSGRNYQMFHYWGSTQTYDFEDCMHLRYKYNAGSPWRHRFFNVHEHIE